MELHEQLAALAAQRGRAVFANPEGLRAALEDFLDEQSASVGELNLLVDAVRLGGLAQLEANLAHGAQPEAAVAAAGEFLARQRGTTDQGSCQWACAALGHAVGVVPAPVAQRLHAFYRSGSPATPQGPPAGAPTVSPVAAPQQYPAPQGAPQGGWSAPQQPWTPQMVAGQGAPGWGPAPAKKSKAPIIAVGVAVAALLIGGGVVWAVVGSGDDDKKSADEPTSSIGTDDPTEDPTDDPTTVPSGDALADMTPTQIRDEVVAAMAQVKSLNMDGTLEAEGMSMDISMDTEGRCQGTMEVQGGRADIVSDGTDMYMKGNEEFWIASSGEENPEQFLLDMFTDKWVRMANSAASTEEFCDLDTMLEEFVGSSGAPDFTVDGTTTHNGTQAVRLAGDDGGTMLVANYAPYHLLEMVDVGDEAGEFTFSRYNEELKLEIPKDYVDIPS